MTLPGALPNALPSVLADNPRLDRWLNFASGQGGACDRTR
jgi:hypothetical protein